MLTREIAEVELALDDEWFVLSPAGEVAAEEAFEMAEAAWQRRRTRGASDDDVVAGAGESLAAEILRVRVGLASALEAGALAAAWVPLPELGTVPVVVVAQVVEQGLGRRPGEYAASARHTAETEADCLSIVDVRAELPGGTAEGVHLITAEYDPSRGMAAVEERVMWALFPHDSSDFIEVAVFASSAGTYVDMPTQTLDILDSLRISYLEVSA